MRLFALVFPLAALVLHAAPAHAGCEDQCQYSSCDTSCELCTQWTPYGCPTREWSTCGVYGVCDPCAGVACNYQQVTPYSDCGLDADGHTWGVRLELHQVALLRDANGNSCCPDRWVTQVSARRDCRLAFTESSVLNCCSDWLGRNTCLTLFGAAAAGACHW